MATTTRKPLLLTKLPQTILTVLFQWLPATDRSPFARTACETARCSRLSESMPLAITLSAKAPQSILHLFSLHVLRPLAFRYVTEQKLATVDDLHDCLRFIRSQTQLQTLALPSFDFEGNVHLQGAYFESLRTMTSLTALEHADWGRQSTHAGDMVPTGSESLTSLCNLRRVHLWRTNNEWLACLPDSIVELETVSLHLTSLEVRKEVNDHSPPHL